tara:strand:- start:119 stop:397 length:279 start_codon:yes stop_codon:yes gene_type:complete
MAIKPPAWCSDAVPTLNGWKHPKTGEILVGGSISAADIKAWDEEKNPKPVVVETFKPKPKARTLKESPVTEDEFAAEHLEEEIEDPKPRRLF